MYVEAKPVGQTRIAGGVIAIGLTSILAVAISAGLNREIIIAPKTDTTITLMDMSNTEPVVDTPEPVQETLEVSLDAPVIDPILPDEFLPIIDESLIAAATEPTPSTSSPTTAISSNSTAPKIQVRSKPLYPNASVRAQEEGVTSLSVCVSASGKATSAQLIGSSGHVRLDDAALKWVREARFKPGTVDGKPQAMCEHTVAYEWELKNAR